MLEKRVNGGSARQAGAGSSFPCSQLWLCWTSGPLPPVLSSGPKKTVAHIHVKKKGKAL